MMRTAAQQLAFFQTTQPVLAEALIGFAQQQGDRGIEALAKASGVSPADLRALLQLDAPAAAPLGTLSPTARAGLGGVAAGQTTAIALLQQRAKDAQAMIASAQTQRMHKEVVTTLTEVLPPDVLRLLKASDTSIRMLSAHSDELLYPSVKAMKQLGPAYAAMTSREQSEETTSGGYNNKLLNEITIYDSTSATRLRTCLVHEMMHTIDRCGWKDGMQRSLQRDFFGLFFDMQEQKRFPTKYAATDVVECFAEAATMYLTPHEANENGKPVVRDRAYLQREFPKLHAFMQHFFEVELPATKAIPSQREIARGFADYVKQEHAHAAPFISVMAQKDAMKIGKDLYIVGRLFKDSASQTAAVPYLQHANTAESRALLKDIERASRVC